MKIFLEKINWKKIKEDIDKHIDEEFKNFKTFISLVKKYNHEKTIALLANNVMITIINAFDYKIKEKGDLIKPPINSFLFGVDPYTNKYMFNSEFLYEIKNNEVILSLQVEPIEKINEHLLFSIDSQIKAFKDYLVVNKTELFENSITESYKVRLLEAFERMKEIIKIGPAELEKLQITVDEELLMKEIGYQLVGTKMPIIFEVYKNGNN